MTLLTTADAARRLGVTPVRVWQLIQARRLPAQKVGRDWLIHEADLHFVEHRPTGRPPRLEPWDEDE